MLEKHINSGSKKETETEKRVFLFGNTVTFYGPEVDSGSNINKYEGKEWPARRADNLTAICEPIA
jgi:hypothetical protein